jgi:hypothetical protein
MSDVAGITSHGTEEQAAVMRDADPVTRLCSLQKATQINEVVFVSPGQGYQDFLI